MIIEFDNTYSETRPTEKMYVTKVTGKVNSIKYIQEFQAALPEISNDRIELVIGGELYTLNKINKCKVRHRREGTPLTSEVTYDTVDGVKMKVFEIYEKLNQWMKEDNT